MPPRQRYGVKVRVLAALQDILRKYPQGDQTLWEALQNSEDAEKATRFCVILDKRTHAHGRCHHDAMHDFQGPALLFIDNGGFTDKDWRSLQYLYESEKRACPGDIGKYGMGSRGFFHLADIMQIVSGTTYAVLDPGNRVPHELPDGDSAGDNGFSVDFIDDGFADHYPDEAHAFSLALDALPDHLPSSDGLASAMNGTIIRLPLRARVCRESSVTEHIIPVAKAITLINSFAHSLQSGQALLFLTRLQQVDVGTIEPDGRFLLECSVTKRTARSPLQDRLFPQQSTNVPSFLRSCPTFADLRERLRAGESAASVTDVTILYEDAATTDAPRSTQWTVAAKVCTDDTFVKYVEIAEVPPVVGIAFLRRADDPECIPPSGRVFSYLPTPIHTHLPFHIQAGFVLKDDRRSFWESADDLAGDHKTWAQWNEYIVRTAFPTMWADLIHAVMSIEPATMRLTTRDAVDGIALLWVDPASIWDQVKPAIQSFQSYAAAKEILPTAGGICVSLQDAIVVPDIDGIFDEHWATVWAWLATADCTAQEATKFVDVTYPVLDLLRSKVTVHDIGWFMSTVFLPAMRRSPSGIPNLSANAISGTMIRFCAWLHEENYSNAVVVKLRREVGFPWVTTVSGMLRAPKATFDPTVNALGAFSVSAAAFVESRFDNDATKRILDILRVWGMKTQLTWDDAVREAEDIAEKRDAVRSRQLFHTIDSLVGDAHAESLAQLSRIPWVLAAAAVPQFGAPSSLTSCHPPEEMQMFACLQDLVHPDHRSSVWLVRGCLSEKLKYSFASKILNKLVAVTTDDLVKQIRVLSDAHAREGRVNLAHFLAVFRALVKRSASNIARAIQSLDSTPWIPCCNDHGTFTLFSPACVAIGTKQNLHPALGRLRDECLEFHKHFSIPHEHSARTIADALHPSCAGEWGQDLRVRLSCALAEQLRATPNARSNIDTVYVPTHPDAALRPSAEVFIDDALWQNATTGLSLLHKQIGPSHGRVLGCTSVRDKLALDCEVAQCGGDFGQEEDLVDRVVRLNADMIGADDVFPEFFQNFDDHGNNSVAYFWDDGRYPTESIVDERTKPLQRSALYICGTASLSDEDVQRMQRVGRSLKREDFRTAGRFGVGLNSMYAYSDCPQLLCNGKLYFFDLSRNFVANTTGTRGKAYNVEELHTRFPDSLAPFDHHLLKRYAVVFRLPLRERQSEIGQVPPDFSAFKNVARNARRFLLFSRSVEEITFTTMKSGNTVAEYKVRRDDALRAFLASTPNAVDLVLLDKAAYAGEINLSYLHSFDEGEPSKGTEIWAVSHVRGCANDDMRRAIRVAINNRADATALLPYGASAVRVRSSDQANDGRVHCFLPTPVVTCCPITVHGCFELPSSRKSIPVAGESDVPPSRATQWNRLLLNGPVAQSFGKLLEFCKKYVASGKWNIATFVALFPNSYMRMDFATVLAKSAMEELAGFSEYTVFPVVTDLPSVFTRCVPRCRRWVCGANNPVFRESNRKLPNATQDLLIADGLKLVWLPDAARKLYDSVSGRVTNFTAEKLIFFLRERWPADVESILCEDAPLSCTQNEQSVLAMLRYIVDGLWDERRANVTSLRNISVNWKELCGLPLLLLCSGHVARVGGQYWSSEGKNLLPSQQGLFVCAECCDILSRPVLPCKAVTTIGIRRIQMQDLRGHQQEVEAHLLDGDAENLWDLWGLIDDDVNQSPIALRAFQAWRILPTCGAGPDSVPMSLALLRTVGETVGLWAFDKSQQLTIRTIARQLNIALAHPDVTSRHRIANVLQRGLVTQDVAFLKLVSQRGILRDEIVINKLLEYCATRDGSFWSDSTAKNVVATLPIFATQQRAFCRLLPDRKYVCVHGPGFSDAMMFIQRIPSGSEILLRYPSDILVSVYGRLGIEMVEAVDYVTTYIVPQIALAAKTLLADYLDFLAAFFQQIQRRDRNKITDSLKLVNCVLCADQEVRKPEEVLSPDVQVSELFAGALTSSFPDPSFFERHHTVLTRLSLRSNLTDVEILACARYLAGEHEVTDTVQRKSTLLLEEIAANLSLTWQLSHVHRTPTADLMAAVNLPLVVAHNGEATQWVERLAKNAMADQQSTPRILVPLTNVAHPNVTNVLWTTRSIADSSCFSTKFCWMVSSYSEQLAKIGFITEKRHVTLCQVISHLQQLSSFVEPLQFVPTSPLAKQFEESWALLNTRLQDSPFPDLLSWRTKKCIPALTNDAAGATFRLAAPSRTFFQWSFRRFPPGAFDEPHFPLIAADSICNFKVALKAVGSRCAPELADWALTTKTLAEHDSWNLPNKRKIADFCLDRVRSFVTESDVVSQNSIVHLHLWGSDDKLHPVQNVVCNNRLSWGTRCAQLWATKAELKLDAKDYEFRQKLRIPNLSAVLKEQVSGESTVYVPMAGSREWGLLEFFRSAEFCRALSMVLELPSRTELSRFLRELPFTWHVELHSEFAFEDGTVLCESKAQTPSFVSVDGDIHVCRLKTKANSTEPLAQSLKGALSKNNSQWWVRDSIQLVRLVESGDPNNPRPVQDVLAQYNIQSVSADRKRSDYLPGDRVPIEWERHLSQSFALAFEAEEIAVTFVDGHQYIFVMILPRASPPGAHTDWSDLYLIDDGSKNHRNVKRLALFKLFLSTSQASVETRLVVASAVSPGTDVSSSAANEASDETEVRDTLTCMDSLSDEDYKVVCRGLYLKWHPDRATCSPVFATRIFCLIREHAEARARASPATTPTPPTPATTTPTWTPGPTQRTCTRERNQCNSPSTSTASGTKPQADDFFAEFDHEHTQRRARFTQPSSFAEHAFRQMRTDMPARRKNLDEATAWYAQAVNELDSARLLMEHDFCSQCILHCEQTVEMLLKSVLLRTCGLTDDEEFTRGHHIGALMRDLQRGQRGSNGVASLNVAKKVAL
eukprot:GEMP01000088.1.p1 GENE.GEMP01000088.1~~GEMP01000088.1.p1  ORF type:complete len:2901 (+),score=597.39 GEMP01000088.1:225-8927(+)